MTTAISRRTKAQRNALRMKRAYLCVCSSMGGMERSVRLGLVALAMSDMVFCTLYLMSTWIPNSALYSPYDNLLRLYFRIYHEVKQACLEAGRSVNGMNGNIARAWVNGHTAATRHTEHLVDRKSSMIDRLSL